MVSKEHPWYDLLQPNVPFAVEIPDNVAEYYMRKYKEKAPEIPFRVMLPDAHPRHMQRYEQQEKEGLVRTPLDWPEFSPFGPIEDKNPTSSRENGLSMESQMLRAEAQVRAMPRHVLQKRVMDTHSTFVDTAERPRVPRTMSVE